MIERVPTLYVPRGSLPQTWESKNAEERERLTGSGLISAQEWLEFIEFHLPKVNETVGWVRLLVTAVVAIHQGALLLARRIRKNATWTGSGTQEDWLMIEQVAMQKLSWFRQNRPGVLESKSLPRWANFLLEAVEGAFLTIARVAREVDQIQRKGHLLVNVSPLATDDIDQRPAEESRG
jgi:hypothetical protein